MNGNETIFVAGGSGFIGRNIVEFFGDKVNVLAPSHKQLDLLSQEAVWRYFRENDVDYIINCASIGGNRKYPGGPEIVEANLRMFFNLAEHASHVNKMIHFGSGAEYDKRRPLCKIAETSFGICTPADPYGFSKYAISKYIEQSDKIVCLRLFGVFGKYEDYEYKFISNAIVKNLFHFPIYIRQNVFFDWLYVDDLMRILPYFLNDITNSYKDYNVTPSLIPDQTEPSLVDIAHAITSYTEINSDVFIGSQGLNNEYTGRNSRLMRSIGPFEFTSMEKSLPELIRYYQLILPSIDREKIQADEYVPRGTP